MVVPLSVAKRKRFCSRRCLGMSNARRLNATRRDPKEWAAANLPPPRYGRAHPRFAEPIALTCKQCGSLFGRKPWQMRQAGVTGDFCSARCRGLWRKTNLSGENSPHWLGGPKTYRGRGWKVARLAAVERQGGRCADCGKHVGVSLPVHHIRPFREFQTPLDANRAENLVGVCQSCHMKREGSLVLFSAERHRNSGGLAPPR